jgi:hypothetical protein
MLSLLLMVTKSYSVADLIFYTLTSYGLCYILMEAKVLNFVRDKITKIKFFKNLLNCSLCTGFWTGLLIGTYIPTYNNIFFALYSSATCYLIYLVNYTLLNQVYPEKEK